MRATACGGLWTCLCLAVLFLEAEGVGEVCAKQNITNGCSVPFQLPFFYKDQFKPACNRHDVCYYCGARFGLTRDDCDKAFLLDMNIACAFTTVANRQPTPRGRRSAGGSPPVSLRQLRNFVLDGRRQLRSFHLNRKSLPLSFLRDVDLSWAPEITPEVTSVTREGSHLTNTTKNVLSSNTRPSSSASPKLTDTQGRRLSNSERSSVEGLFLRERQGSRRRHNEQGLALAAAAERYGPNAREPVRGGLKGPRTAAVDTVNVGHGVRTIVRGHGSRRAGTRQKLTPAGNIGPSRKGTRDGHRPKTLSSRADRGSKGGTRRGPQRTMRAKRAATWCQTFAQSVYYPAVTTFGLLHFSLAHQVTPECTEPWIISCLPVSAINAARSRV